MNLLLIQFVKTVNIEENVDSHRVWRASLALLIPINLCAIYWHLLQVTAVIKTRLLKASNYGKLLLYNFIAAISWRRYYTIYSSRTGSLHMHTHLSFYNKCFRKSNFYKLYGVLLQIAVPFIGILERACYFPNTRSPNLNCALHPVWEEAL